MAIKGTTPACLNRATTTACCAELVPTGKGCVAVVLKDAKGRKTTALKIGNKTGRVQFMKYIPSDLGFDLTYDGKLKVKN